MRAVIQRVQNASVTVNGAQISSIGKGICVLIGISRKDEASELDYIAKKILNTRVFDDPVSGIPWKQSVMEANLEVLCVSQFTLYGNCYKGNKPDFHGSMKAEEAREMYSNLLSKLRSTYSPDKIKDGEFQAMMLVNIANDGPVTLIVDTDAKKNKKED